MYERFGDFLLFLYFQTVPENPAFAWDLTSKVLKLTFFMLEKAIGMI